MYFHKGDLDRAIRDLDQAIQFNPSFALAYNNRGSVYARKGDSERAISDFNQAIYLDPKLADTYINRGLYFVGKGEKENAIADFEKFLELCSITTLRQDSRNELEKLGVK